MEIIRAADMGFCFGVRRAVETMEQAAARLGRMTSLGSVVHNQQVVERLARLGVEVIGAPAEADSRPIAITSHGVAPQVLEEIRRLGVQVVDTTCPIVARSQQWAKRLSRDGFTVLIFGDPDHREVRAVAGWAGGKGMALPNTEALDAVIERLPARVAVLSQTTETKERFASFVGHLMSNRLSHIRELRVINTLCHATTNQQAAARELARRVDLMIVVGGRESANTRHLADVSREEGVETHHIEWASEVDPRWLAGKRSVGITAGASTPDETVDAVEARLRELADERNDSRKA
ncbi:MAG: 4-hydroxy-3-methylbut-2-enyl diphosphate reductase [Dehalococcoidia bacterium]|nr:4-hydroxy-3-methylbut-2-enyl diphosphate reductase [Dehalococcoidia bacterium]